MADIPLRTYVEQLDNLIERKQVDEVIAHCRHILGLYPKHLDTYRMLGKALLEKGRHGDAADIFQRVLSVMPDDFISHVGMAIVREDEVNLDASIWHMERAYEAAPANGAIQQELCRLYGRRDGVVPAKARLTRGALARMYAQGGLYMQAEAELKAALAAEADRVDLLTKLAEVYWQTDQAAQAAQTSAAIIQKLPYSLEANRILVDIFRAQGRPADAAVYRQRLEALDPYEAFADPAADGAGASQVDPAKVLVARLDYVPGMESSGSPDWLASIGAKFEEPASTRAPEAQPDWLSAAGESAAPGAPADYQPGQGSVPDWLKDLDTAPTAAPEAQNTGSPDWLKELSGATQPLPTSQAQGDQGLPAWLATATGPLPADAVPDWMLQSPPAQAETGASPLPTPDDIADLPTVPLPLASATPPASALPTPPTPAASDASAAVPAETPGELPDWLKTTAGEENEEELPDWLKAITAQPLSSSDNPAGQAAALPAADIPDWLQKAAPDDATPVVDTSVPAWLQTAANAPTGVGARPDWLKVATGELDPAKVAHLLPPEPAAAKTADAVAGESAAAATSATADAAAASEAPVTPQAPTEAAPVELATPLSQPAEPASVDELPSWLKGAALAGQAVAATVAAVSSSPSQTEPPPAEMAATDAVAPVLASADVASSEPALVEPAQTPTPEPVAEMPDITKAAVPAEASTAMAAEALDEAASPVAAEPAAAPSLPTAPAADEALPDWLQAATASPVPSPDETPVWLQTAPAGPSLVNASASPEAELPVPDWLKDLAASAPPPDATPISAAEPGAAQPVELPEYLQPASPEAIARAEKPLEMEPEQEEPEEAEPAQALPAVIPDWLKALAPTPDPVPAAAEPVEAVAPAGAMLEDSLSWLDELTAGATIAGATAAAEPASDELPPWLAAPETAPTDATAPAGAVTPAVVPGGLADDTLAAEIPPWAQNEEPGPSDTIASWLAGKHVPDWLRQPANEAPGLPAVEWEPDSPPPPVEPEPVDSLAATAAATMPTTPSAATEPSAPATAEPAGQPELAAAPDLESMDPEAAFRWLESLAAHQGARPEELFSETAEAAPQTSVEDQPTPATPAMIDAAREPSLSAASPEPMAAIDQPAVTAGATEPVVEAETVDPAAPSTGPADISGLEEYLRQTEAAIPVEHLLDTAPTKKPEPEPAPETVPPADATPTAANLEAPAEPVAATSVAAGPAAESAEFDADAAMRWLEGLAAQQGANPEELLTAPEDRTLEAPKWVAAEQAAMAVQAEAAQEPIAEPASPAPQAAVEEPTPPIGALAMDTTEVVAQSPATAEAVAAEAPLAEAQAEVTPEETVAAPAETVPAPVAEVAPEPALVAPAETPVAPASEVPPEAAQVAPARLDADADAEAAMRWLEGLAAQQGANPEELLTAPEERTLEVPAWVSAHAAEAPLAPEAELAATAAATPPAAEPAAEPAPAGADAEPPAAAEEPEPATAPETPEWLKAFAPAQAQAEKAEPAAAAETAEPSAPPEPAATHATADLEKLSRLSERLAAARRAREAEMEARFAEQRSQQEAARRWVEERLEAKHVEPTLEPEAAQPLPAPVAAEAPQPAAEAPAPALRRHQIRPLIRARARRPAPQEVTPAAVPMPLVPVPAAPVPAATVVPAEALAHGQAALSAGDYHTAVAHLSPLVEQGHHLDTVVQSLEGVVAAGPAPAPVHRLLGDAYLRNDQTQKALDAYRQALKQL